MPSADTSLSPSLGLLISVDRDVKRRSKECLASALILPPSGCTVIVQVRTAGAVAVARKAASLKTALHVEMLSLTFC